MVPSEVPPIELEWHRCRAQLVEQLRHLWGCGPGEHGRHALAAEQLAHPAQQVPGHRRQLPLGRHDLDALHVRVAEERPLPHDHAVPLDHEHLAVGRGAERQQLRELPADLAPFAGVQNARRHEGLPPSTSSVTGTFTDADFR